MIGILLYILIREKQQLVPRYNKLNIANHKKDLSINYISEMKSAYTRFKKQHHYITYSLTYSNKYVNKLYNSMMESSAFILY